MENLFRGRPAHILCGMALLKRVTLALTAVAFLFAAALPNAGAMMPMASAAGVAGGMAKPCSDCPSKPPIHNSVPKMVCGALACAGVVIAFPERQALYLPAFGRIAYSPREMTETAGVVPAPDPFPPRTTVLV